MVTAIGMAAFLYLHRPWRFGRIFVPTGYGALACHKSEASPSFQASSRAVAASILHQEVKPRPIRIVVAMTGATGAVLGIELLSRLQQMSVETHLVISKWATETIKFETNISIKDVKAIASFSYSPNDAYAKISSGSFQTDGMIIVPCSMRTLSAVRTGFADDLICRAADVILKERRKLVIVVRETPLSGIHLENMLALSRLGAVIFPPVPAFYTHPKSISDMVNQSVGRMLDMLGLETDSFTRWDGNKASEK
jgi:4-hydroxy-3-polyprenylbenzoate decarboxylase